MTTPYALFYVATGGAIGATLRYMMMQYFSRIVISASFPLSTFTVNIVGAFALGVIAATRWHHLSTHPATLLFAVGVLGSFTTFSTFSLDALLLLQRQHYGIAFVYMIGSVVSSLLACAAGLYIMRHILNI